MGPQSRCAIGASGAHRRPMGTAYKPVRALDRLGRAGAAALARVPASTARPCTGCCTRSPRAIWSSRRPVTAAGCCGPMFGGCRTATCPPTGWFISRRSNWAGCYPSVQWPSDFATFDRGTMTIQESTHRFSRLSIHRAMVGRRRTMLEARLGGPRWPGPIQARAR